MIFVLFLIKLQLETKMIQSPFYEDIKTVRDYSVFSFISIGKREIIKIVAFQKTREDDVYNLAMGDLINSATFSDREISNNGDVRKVLTTIVNIVQIYTKKYPERSIFIQGNTDLKTSTYQRIIRMYYAVFSKEFNIWGYINNNVKEEFSQKNNYVAFIVKRK